MPDDAYTTIPIAVWPRLRTVRLYDATWLDIVRKHPEFGRDLPSQRIGLETAIANPGFLYESRTDPEGSVVVVSDAFTYFRDPVVVPIRLIGAQRSGRVLTAYFDSSGYGGKVLWSDGNE